MCPTAIRLPRGNAKIYYGVAPYRSSIYNMPSMSLIVKLVGTALAVFVSAHIIPGISVSDFYVALLVSLLLGLINVLIRPILIILTLPINIITLGLFSFIINAFLFWSVAALVTGFSVDGFLPALVGSLFVSAVGFLLHKNLLRNEE